MGNRAVTTDLTYDELKALLRDRGYQEQQLPPSKRNRIAFIHPETEHIIRLEYQRGDQNLSRYHARMLNNEL
ncbi:MAG: type II toxin-antitoxin system HicA family toxin [Alkalispirochaeta sp.]